MAGLKKTIITITHIGGDVSFESWKKLLELITFKETKDLRYNLNVSEVEED